MASSRPQAAPLRRLRRCAARTAAAVAGACVGAAAQAQTQSEPVPVDLELVLAVDVSQSMDFDEHRLQRMGYVEAFRHDDVVDAILYGPRGQIAVTYVEWGDAYDQVQIVPWTLIASREDAEAFADALASEPIYPGQRTSISQALIRSATLIENNEFDGVKHVIDISGDGPNNDGPYVEVARDEVAARGVTINGLPITLKDATSWYDIENLDAYYEDCVIAGPGAFVAPVKGIEELGATIRGKLVLEIVGLPAQLHHAQIEIEPGEPAVQTNCLIGEQLWQSRGGRFFR